jgi:hypothetical protein
MIIFNIKIKWKLKFTAYLYMKREQNTEFEMRIVSIMQNAGRPL